MVWKVCWKSYICLFSAGNNKPLMYLSVNVDLILQEPCTCNGGYRLSDSTLERYIAAIRRAYGTGQLTVGHMKHIFDLTDKQAFAILHCSEGLTDEQCLPTFIARAARQYLTYPHKISKMRRHQSCREAQKRTLSSQPLAAPKCAASAAQARHL